MIDNDELKRLALRRGIKKIGYAEKDYILDLLLYAISKISKNELIFKGGTSLSKIHGLRRFSEELDFSLSNPEISGQVTNIPKKILPIMERFGVLGKISSEKALYNSLMITYHFQGPRFSGKQHQITSLRVDINLKSTVVNPPNTHYYTSIYPEIPMFPVIVMDQTEIAAEKIRAIQTRDKARDIYDLYYLLRADQIPTLELINKKLLDYSMQFQFEIFVDAMMKKRILWEKELSGLAFEKISDFGLYVDLIKSKLSKLIIN